MNKRETKCIQGIWRLGNGTREKTVRVCYVVMNALWRKMASEHQE